MKTNPSQPHLTLVGAGPGDPDLLTLKGAKALAKAQVVLYDALVNTELLELSPASCRKVFVGKSNGMHKFSQDEINDLIVRYAREYGHVVRLKGGDPLVFGRGHEEILYAQNHGIPGTIVPGISSAAAVPAYAGYSLTLRGVSESFWVITGTNSQHQLSRDLQHAIHSKATVVLLMATRKLEEISQIYSEAGKGDTSFAMIQNGTTDKEKKIQGTVQDLPELAASHRMGSPAILVIGGVVDHPMELHQFEDAMLGQFSNLSA